MRRNKTWNTFLFHSDNLWDLEARLLCFFYSTTYLLLCILWKRTLLSSATFTSSSWFVKIHWMPVVLTAACRIIQVTVNRRIIGDSGQPWRTPVCMEKASVSFPSWMTWQVASSYSCWIIVMNFGGKPWYCTSLQITSLLTFSNALWNSLKTEYMRVCNSRDCSVMLWRCGLCRICFVGSLHVRPGVSCPDPSSVSHR